MSFVVNIKGHKSHAIVSDALTMLESIEHRGAFGDENNSGDGAGILIQVPHAFLFDECIKLGIHLPPYSKYGVGMLFFPREVRLREECRGIFNLAAERLGLEILGYRHVPVQPEGLGPTALSTEPVIEQVFVGSPDSIRLADDFERRLFLLRNYASHTIHTNVKRDGIGFYVASLSYKTIVYKGQLSNRQLRTYFPDLSNKRVISAFGMVHCRFATQTLPSWRSAQPFRYSSHKGEINTLQGNLNGIIAGEKTFVTPYYSKEEMDMLLPIIGEWQSDSACLDNIIELLQLCGRSLPHVMMMLVPENWDGNASMDPVRRAFYEFQASLMGPWEGPAFLSFTDGKIIGAMLDRNGFRSSQYLVTTDDRVILAAEAGVLPVDPGMVKEKGRLKPGKLFLVDLEQERVISDEELKQVICSQKPYGEWLHKYKIRMDQLPQPPVMNTHLEHDPIVKYQKVFGYTTEDFNKVIQPMMLTGQEPLGAMAVDIPLAVLSGQPQHLSSYFKQLFAQVTSPAIDSIYERSSMSLTSLLGSGSNLLEEDPLSCHNIVLQHPVLTNHDLAKISSIDTGIFRARTLHITFRADGRANSLQNALDRVCRYAVDAVDDGYQVLILSDRTIDSEHAPIPSLLATAAVYNFLVRKGYRGQISIIVEAGDVWETHHFACLIGFGAAAINPYLALSSIRDLKLEGRMETDIDVERLKNNYIQAVCDGLLKVFSKMGISTLQSYQGAQIFEIIGLDTAVVQKYFTGGAISRIQGMTLDDIAKEVCVRHQFAFSRKEPRRDLLPAGGVYQWGRTGETHLFTPATVHLLQYAVRTNDAYTFSKYSKLVNDQSDHAVTLRSLLEFRRRRPAIAIDEVEPAAQIYRRFATAAMSFGSISHEAHSTLAIAMNRLGGRSNSGEGGEDEFRRGPLPGGDSMQSAIRQVASARYGVTNTYLTTARDIQIKIAQGSSPGEGGFLPGGKADEWIAKVRRSRAGLDQQSPPSNQDVHSMDDLAQLIFDLKNANPEARVGVKLASKLGIGSIAAGVVKAKAEAILVSGHDGGTGASNLGSIRHAGLPWELGLSECNQTLIRHKLRGRVVLQVDGQLKTGRDIAIATLLGAEEWGIGTAALIAEGCVMTRACHLNTCPVGIATQDPELRKRFTGDPGHIVNFFRFLTEDLRSYMAELGFRTVEEMVGQVECLQLTENKPHWKYSKLDLSPVLYKEPASLYTALFCQEPQQHGLEKVLDWKLIAAAQPVLQDKERSVFASFTIRNSDRATGALLSNHLSKAASVDALAEDSVHFKFTGSAGQSFGAFCVRGLTFELEGEANDFFGKGLSGARLIVYPSQSSILLPEESVIIGNIALYGATGGEAYIKGQAGERFCVRNSGTRVVVEGIGDYGCEYMASGVVLVLGAVGKNFAAGMQGGRAYLYDVAGTVAHLCNRQTVELWPVGDADLPELKDLLQRHYAYTGSTIAKFILDELDDQVRHFVKVVPVKPSANESDKGSPDRTRGAARPDNERVTDEEPVVAMSSVIRIAVPESVPYEEGDFEEIGLTELVVPDGDLREDVPVAESDDATPAEIVRLRQEIERIEESRQKAERALAEQDRVYALRVETREEIRTAIKQYLVYFNEFVKIAKGKESMVEIRNAEDGLSIEIPKIDDIQQTIQFLKEYAEFAKTIVDRQHVNFENPYLSEHGKDFFLLELKHQKGFLQNSIEIRDLVAKHQIELFQNQIAHLERQIIDLNKQVSAEKHMAGRLLRVLEKSKPTVITYVENKAISNSSSKAKSTARASAKSKASARAKVHFNFEANVEGIQRDFGRFKEQLLQVAPEEAGELAEIEKDLQSIDKKDEKAFKNPALNRLKGFLDKLDDEHSTINKALRVSEKGLTTLQKLASTYNKFAEWLALPQVPRVFLNEK